jgi:hypothetical protein
MSADKGKYNTGFASALCAGGDTLSPALRADLERLEAERAAMVEALTKARRAVRLGLDFLHASKFEAPPGYEEGRQHFFDAIDACDSIALSRSKR